MWHGLALTYCDYTKNPHKQTGTPLELLALLLLAFPLLLTLQQLVELPELTVDNHQLQDNSPTITSE